MEVAGIVLAVLPTVVEAFKCYVKAAEALSTFKQYSSAVTNLERKVKTHETIFSNSSENLKSAIEGYLGTVDRGQSSHTQTRTENRLQESLETCRDNLRNIKTLLEIITEKLESFKSENNSMTSTLHNKPPLHENIKLTWKQLSIRFKLVWSKDRIDDEVNDLRDDVVDFYRISKQVVQFIFDINPSARAQPRQGNTKWSRSFAKEESLETFKRIRQASSILHSSLAKHWLCPTHHSHKINICSAKCSNNRLLYFEAVLAVYGSEETEKPICIEVESDDQSERFNEVVQDGPNPSSPTDENLHHADSTLEGGVFELRRVMATDLTHIPDFCRHFQEQCETTLPGKQLLGYISELPMQRFFSLAPDRRVSGLPRSLSAELVSSDNVPSAFSRSHTVNMAASIAASVLQFYSTPWLSRSWSSKDVVFFQNQSPITRTFNPLYFSTQLEQKAAKGKEVQHEAGSSITSLGGSSKRNELLFQLGVVLLEIGLARPWDSMRREVVENGKTQDGADDYKIADKLAHSYLRLHMGPEYSTIVRKCLGCDFGLGESNFDNEQLQAVYLRDVVQSLQAMSDGLVKVRNKLAPD